MYGVDMHRFYILLKDGLYYVKPMGYPGDPYAPLPSGCTYGSTVMVTSSGCSYKRLFDPSSMEK